MKFLWDEAKRKRNLLKHQLDFTDAKTVFSGITYTFEDHKSLYEEQRLITIGMLYGKVVVVAHTEIKDKIRIISMRKATKNEQKIFYKGFIA